MTRPPARKSTPDDPQQEHARGPYQLETFSSRENLGYLLKRAWIQLASSVDQRLAPFDLTYPQFVILVRLNEGSCSTAAELAREVGTDTGAMTRMLDRLEAKGALHRARSAADRRVINLEITDAGRAMANNAMAAAINVLNQHFSDFTPAELAQLEQLLQRIIMRSD